MSGEFKMEKFLEGPVFRPMTEADIALLRTLVMQKLGVPAQEVWAYMEESMFHCPLTMVSHEEAQKWIAKLWLA